MIMIKLGLHLLILGQLNCGLSLLFLFPFPFLFRLNNHVLLKCPIYKIFKFDLTLPGLIQGFKGLINISLSNIVLNLSFEL